MLGDRRFYQKVMLIAVPIMVQSGITNLVGLLDNIMVGRLGTDSMSGVAIVNQLLFVFNLCIFGGLSGIGIFTAQFYGKGDDDGIRYTVRQQIAAAAALTLIGVIVLKTAGDPLIRMYLHTDSSGGSVEETFRCAKEYLGIMFFGMLPFGGAQVYASTLRNVSETFIPMIAGIAAVAVNLAGNYILIYGKFGAPAMGVSGAAAATVISRFVELLVTAWWTHSHTGRYRFIRGVYRRLFEVPAALNRRVIIRAVPLLMNESFWAAGQAVLVQNYSIRGLSSVAALNISQTIGNVFSISFISLGSAIAILMGQMLGAGEIRRAREEAVKYTFFTVLFCMAFGLIQLVLAGVFPRMYNTTYEIRHLAADLIRISALCMPIYSYINALYFTLRSGGKTFITFLFDSGFNWVVMVPLAFFLSRYTNVSLQVMFLTVQLSELIKCVMGTFMIRSGNWAVNITKG